jgi:heat shock protein HslJ
MRTLGRLALVGVLVAMVAACSSDDGDPSSTSTSRSSGGGSLAGTQWVLSDSAALPTQGVSVTAEFTAGRVSGTSGCNTYRAPYETDGSSLTIGPDIAATQKACPPPASTVEDAYLARLPEVQEYAIDGSTLRLLDADGNDLLTYKETDGDAAILGSWTVTGYYTGDAIQGVMGDTPLTADFEGLTVSGDGGCNGFNGPFETGRDTISIGPLQSTLRACEDPELQTQEQQYFAALELAERFRVTGDRLELLRPDDLIAVTFERTAG